MQGQARGQLQQRCCWEPPHLSEASMPWLFLILALNVWGAPMNAFVRLSDQVIRLRSQVYEPDYLIVLDPSLMRGFDVFEGFRPGGIAIINHHEKVQCPKPIQNIKVFTVPGNDIATEVLGRPIGNTTILGAFAAATNEFGLEALQQAILERFSGEVAKKNAEAARRGYEYIKKGV